MTKNLRHLRMPATHGGIGCRGSSVVLDVFVGASRKESLDSVPVSPESSHMQCRLACVIAEIGIGTELQEKYHSLYVALFGSPVKSGLSPKRIPMVDIRSVLQQQAHQFVMPHTCSLVQG